MKKRIVALLLATLMAFTAGCGQMKEDTASMSTQESEEDEDEDESEEESTESTEDAVDPEIEKYIKDLDSYSHAESYDQLEMITPTDESVTRAHDLVALWESMFEMYDYYSDYTELDMEELITISDEEKEALMMEEAVAYYNDHGEIVELYTFSSPTYIQVLVDKLTELYELETMNKDYLELDNPLIYQNNNSGYDVAGTDFLFHTDFKNYIMIARSNNHNGAWTMILDYAQHVYEHVPDVEMGTEEKDASFMDEDSISVFAEKIAAGLEPADGVAPTCKGLNYAKNLTQMYQDYSAEMGFTRYENEEEVYAPFYEPQPNRLTETMMKNEDGSVTHLLAFNTPTFLQNWVNILIRSYFFNNVDSSQYNMLYGTSQSEDGTTYENYLYTDYKTYIIIYNSLEGQDTEPMEYINGFVDKASKMCYTVDGIKHTGSMAEYYEANKDEFDTTGIDEVIVSEDAIMYEYVMSDIDTTELDFWDVVSLGKQYEVDMYYAYDSFATYRDAIASDIGDESIRLVVRYYDCNHTLLLNQVW